MSRREDLKTDEIFKSVGELGRYQLCIAAALLLPCIFVGAANLSFVFIAAEPQHRCLVKECEIAGNATYNSSFLSFTIPVSSPGGAYEQCRRYSPHHHNTTLHGSASAAVNGLTLLQSISTADDQCLPENFSNNTIQDCEKDGYVFDNSIYESTLATEFQLVCSKRWVGHATQTWYFLGMMIGALLSGLAADRYGRRPVLIVGLFAMTACSIAIGLVPTLETVDLMRVLTALFSTAAFQTAFVLCLELVGLQHRVFCGVAGQVAFGLGEVLLALAGMHFRRWRMLQIVISVPICPVIFYWLFIPESPRWLSAMRKQKEALEVLRKISRVNRRPIPDHLLPQNICSDGRSNICSATIDGHSANNTSSGNIANGSPSIPQDITSEAAPCSHSHTEPVDVNDEEALNEVVFSRQAASDRNSLSQSIFPSARSTAKFTLLELISTPQLFLRLVSFGFIWMSTTYVYYGLSFNAAEIHHSGPANKNSPYINFILAAVVEVPGYLLGLLLQQCWGRFPALLTSLVLTGSSCIIAAVFINQSLIVQIASLLGKCFITCVFGCIYLHTTEVFPTRARTAVLGTCSTLARCAGMLASFATDLKEEAKGLPMYVFGGVAFFAALCALVQPETKGFPLPSTIEQALRLGKHEPEEEQIATDEEQQMLLPSEEDDYSTS